MDLHRMSRTDCPGCGQQKQVCGMADLCLVEPHAVPHPKHDLEGNETHRQLPELELRHEDQRRSGTVQP